MRNALVLSCLFVSLQLVAGCGGCSNGDPAVVDAGPDIDADPDAVCGDGTVDNGEDCDDSGESATCDADCTDAECGDDTTNPTANEECEDGNTDDGDGCSAACLDEFCGDSAINNVVEICDDGGTTASDGCAGDCTVEAGFVCTGEPSVCLARNGSCALPFQLTAAAGVATGSGNTTGGTSNVVAGVCDSEPTSGIGPDQVFELVVPAGQDVTLLLEPTGYDGLVRLLTSPCDLGTEVIERDEPEGCSDGGGVGGDEFLVYVNLPAGTYYVVVDGYQADDAGAFTLTATMTATTCGDGVVDVAEVCDDSGTTTGDGCGSTCLEEPMYNCTGAPSVCVLSCGNGEIDDPSEECDDDNLVDGDRCSNLCALVTTVTESEPNDTEATADVVTAGAIVRGSIPADDFDIYVFTTAVPVLVDLELYTTVDGDLIDYDGDGTLGLEAVDCGIDGGLDVDPDLRIFDSTGDATDNGTTLVYDDFDGTGNCAYLGPANDNETMLQPGTYYFKVEAYTTGDVIPLYALDVKVTPASAPTVDGLIINEFLADDSTLDVNCDGSTTGTQDEFIELVNATANFVNLTGVTVWDETTVSPRHTFAPLGLVPGGAVVVFSGGAATCASFAGVPVVISGLALSLNNSTGVITIKNAAAADLATVSFPTSTAGISSNLTEDSTDTVVGTGSGVFVNHNTITGAVGNFSPATLVDGNSF